MPRIAAEPSDRLGFHTVSADQLEMFYLNTTGTQHAARATVDDLFELAPPSFASIAIDPTCGRWRDLGGRDREHARRAAPRLPRP